MAKLTLEIAIGNDGILDTISLGEILIRVVVRIVRCDYDLDKPLTRGIMDMNGNTVGSWTIDHKG